MDIVSRPDIWLDPPKEKPFGWTETRHKKFAWELPFLTLQQTWNGWTEHFKTGFLDHRLMFCFHDYGRKGWDVSLDFCGLWHVIVSQVFEKMNMGGDSIESVECDLHNITSISRFVTFSDLFMKRSPTDPPVVGRPSLPSIWRQALIDCLFRSPVQNTSRKRRTRLQVQRPRWDNLYLWIFNQERNVTGLCFDGGWDMQGHVCNVSMSIKRLEDDCIDNFRL